MGKGPVALLAEVYMKRMVGILCALAAVGTWSASASAEEYTHDGFFMRFGFNVGPLIGSQSVEGTSAADGDFGGLTLGYDLYLGGTPVDGLVIGGALIGATTSNPSFESDAGEGELDGTLILAGVALFGNYYFDPTQGFHIQGLLGYAVVDAVSDSGQSGGNDPTGIMFGLGAGYDFFFASQWSVGPFARLTYASTSYETYNFTHIYPSIGATITLH